MILLFLKIKETSGKIEEISGKIWENNFYEILDKFLIKCLGNFVWIILNKTIKEFKFVEHSRKILKTSDCFLIKIWNNFNCQSHISFQENGKKILRKFEKNNEIPKKNW